MRVFAMKPFVTVVVTSYWPGAPVGQCVAAVLEQVETRPIELIVVYHGPSFDLGEDLPPPTKILRVPSESLSDARNHGWETARGEVIVFLDDDTEPCPGWLERLTDRFSNDSSLICLGGLDRPHPDDASFARAVRLQENFFRLHLLRLKAPALRLKGANLAVRRSVRDISGPFGGDASYYGAEDTDLVERISASGLKVEFDQALQIYHRGPTARNLVRKRITEITRGKTPKGLRTIALAALYLAGVVLFALLLPSLLIPYLLLGALAWLALGLAVVVTQEAHPAVLPMVMLVIALEFLLLPLRGITSILRGHDKR